MKPTVCLFQEMLMMCQWHTFSCVVMSYLFVWNFQLRHPLLPPQCNLWRMYSSVLSFRSVHKSNRIFRSLISASLIFECFNFEQSAKHSLVLVHLSVHFRGNRPITPASCSSLNRSIDIKTRKQNKQKNTRVHLWCDFIKICIPLLKKCN